MATIRQVDTAVGTKGEGMMGKNGPATKRISMKVPGDGGVTKPYGIERGSLRSMAHEADAWSNIGGPASGYHEYDGSKEPVSNSMDVAEGGGDRANR